MPTLLSVLVPLLLLTSSTLADTRSQSSDFQDYIDEKQKNISKKVISIFDDIDKSISRWVEEDESEPAYKNQEDIVQIDEFFINDKYLEESENSFLRVRLGTSLESKDSLDFSYKIRAQIPLNRTRKNFQLYIDEMKDDYIEGTPPTSDDQKSLEVGVNFFAPLYRDIKSKYSIGVSGLSVAAKARYSKDFNYKDWHIQPTQQFKYSTKSEFSEETDIYIDKIIIKGFSLFRTTLYRKTQTHIKGFDYSASFAYYLTPSSRKGLSLIQQFWGNSKYTCDANPESFAGISDYSTTVSWRQNIFRKWITYEIQPTLSFHRQYDYDPNYILRFYMDFYFGNI